MCSSDLLNFEYFVYFLLNAFTQACVTFMSQNYGAGEFERCRKITRICAAMGFAFSTALSLVFYLLGENALRFYTIEPAVMEIGLIRMKYCLLMQFVSVFMDVFSGSLRGLGYSLMPALISLASSCGIRLLWIYTIFPKMPNFQMLVSVYPISWLFGSAGTVIAYLIISRRILIRRT